MSLDDANENDEKKDRVYKPGSDGSSSLFSSGFNLTGGLGSSDWNKPRTATTEMLKESFPEGIVEEISNKLPITEDAIKQFKSTDDIIQELESREAPAAIIQNIKSLENKDFPKSAEEMLDKANSVKQAAADKVTTGSNSLSFVLAFVGAALVMAVVLIIAISSAIKNASDLSASLTSSEGQSEIVSTFVESNPDGIIMQSEAVRGTLKALEDQMNIESLKITPAEGSVLTERSGNEYISDVTVIENISKEMSIDSFRNSLKLMQGNIFANYYEDTEIGEDGSILSVSLNKANVEASSFISLFKTEDETYKIVIDTLSRS